VRAYEGIGTAVGIYESSQRLANGCADWTDLLNFAPVVGDIGGRIWRGLDNVGGVKNALNQGIEGVKGYLDDARSVVQDWRRGIRGSTQTPPGIGQLDNLERLENQGLVKLLSPADEAQIYGRGSTEGVNGIESSNLPPFSSQRHLSQNKMFEWQAVGSDPLPPTITVGKNVDELILDHINKRGYPNGQGIGSDMIKQAAEDFGLSKPKSIIAPNIIQADTLSAMKAGKNPSDTAMGKLLTKAAKKMGATSTNIESAFDETGKLWMRINITY
jgi:hypothetical protein